MTRSSRYLYNAVCPLQMDLVHGTQNLWQITDFVNPVGTAKDNANSIWQPFATCLIHQQPDLLLIP